MDAFTVVGLLILFLIILFVLLVIKEVKEKETTAISNISKKPQKLTKQELIEKAQERKHMELQNNYFVSGSKISNTKEYKKLTGKKAVLNSFVVFDFETTGLSPHDSEIIEIGAIRVDNINSNNHRSFSSLVKPSKSISKRVTAINGIDNDMVADAKNIAEVLREFHDFIGDLPLIAHNASFDMKFLLHYLEEHGLEFMDNAVVDTLSLARKAYPALENHKLPTLVNHIGIKVNQLHRASDDSLAALYVYTTSMQILHGAYKN